MISSIAMVKASGEMLLATVMLTSKGCKAFVPACVVLTSLVSRDLEKLESCPEQLMKH